jgi:putative heme-binding domain-containing protein
MALLLSDTPQARLARSRVEAVVQRASDLSLDARAPVDRRLAAIALLGHTTYASAGTALQGLLVPRHSSEVQVAALRALAQLPEREGAASLVQSDRWQAFTPEVREAVLSVLLTEEQLTEVLLDALERKQIAAATLGASRRSRLMNHRNAAVQARARGLLAAVESGDRMQVYERLRGVVLAASGNAANGKRIFAAQCAACHTFDGSGGSAGPDLSGIRNQPADAILLHVLVPDHEITPGYHAYLVETQDGRTVSGRLESSAPNSLTLRDASSQAHTILRSDVRSISASPASLMPAGLEHAMSEQDLADLIAHLKIAPGGAR